MKVDIPVDIVEALKLHFSNPEVITDEILEMIKPEIKRFVEKVLNGEEPCQPIAKEK